jgi:hypothetical protein
MGWFGAGYPKKAQWNGMWWVVHVGVTHPNSVPSTNRNCSKTRRGVSLPADGDTSVQRELNAFSTFSESGSIGKEIAGLVFNETSYDNADLVYPSTTRPSTISAATRSTSSPSARSKEIVDLVPPLDDAFSTFSERRRRLRHRQGQGYR